ncbi:40S small subunit processome assembly factor 1-like [Haemaphysalis longicornis]
MGLSSKILKRLNAYGDSFLDNSEAAAKTDASKLRTRKRNLCGQDNIKTCTTVLSKLSELERMRLELGLDDPCEEPACEEPLPARRESVPVVVYQNPSKRKLRKHHREEQEDESGVQQQNGNEISFKKARYDILKFGIKGLDKPEQEEAKIALAVQLGAKPPKNKYVNYKEFIHQKKEQKVKEREEKIANARMGVKAKRQGNVRQGKARHAQRHTGVHYVSKELISQVQRKKAK